MPLSTCIKNMIVTFFLVLALPCGAVSAQNDIESRKIDFLIASVANLAGAKFVRNDAEYDGKEAADHLRMKLKRAAGKVRTAEDFIALCASKSYISGRPYTIKFSSGETITSEAFFRKKLRQYNSSTR